MAKTKTKADCLHEWGAFAGDACRLVAEAQKLATDMEPAAALMVLSVANTYATLATAAAMAALSATDG